MQFKNCNSLLAAQEAMGGASRRNTVHISGPQKLKTYEAFCDTSMHLIVCQRANKPISQNVELFLEPEQCRATLPN